MRCTFCGDEISPRGSWALGQDYVCRACYEQHEELDADMPPTLPETTFTSISAGLSLALIVWFGLVAAFAACSQWVAR